MEWKTRLRGRTATQRSKKGSEKVLGRVLGKGSQKGSEKGVCCWLYILRRDLRRGSEKGVSRRCLERPHGEYDPWGVRPTEIQKIVNENEAKLENSYFSKISHSFPSFFFLQFSGVLGLSFLSGLHDRKIHRPWMDHFLGINRPVSKPWTDHC